MARLGWMDWRALAAGNAYRVGHGWQRAGRSTVERGGKIVRVSVVGRQSREMNIPYCRFSDLSG